MGSVKPPSAKYMPTNQALVPTSLALNIDQERKENNMHILVVLLKVI